MTATWKPEDASSERYRLGSKEICLGHGADGVELLPAKLRDLLERSDNLYRRIARLDDVLFDAKEPDGPPASRNTSTAWSSAFGSDGAA